MFYYILNDNLGAIISELSAPGDENRFADTLRPLASSGGRLPWPLHHFHIELARMPGGALFTIWGGPHPISTTGAAWSDVAAEEIWDCLERMYLGLSDKDLRMMGGLAVAARPACVPWTCTVRLPAYYLCKARAQFEWPDAVACCYGRALHRDYASAER
jgi:hypothetical protein